MNDDQPQLPSFLQFGNSNYYAYQAELTDKRLPAFIDALLQQKCIKFQSKVFRVDRILLTDPSIVVLRFLKNENKNQSVDVV